MPSVGKKIPPLKPIDPNPRPPDYLGTPLSDMEVRDWMLGLGHNNEERIAAVRELLDHGTNGEMHPYDKRVCGRVLVELEQELERVRQYRAEK